MEAMVLGRRAAPGVSSVACGDEAARALGRQRAETYTFERPGVGRGLAGLDELMNFAAPRLSSVLTY